MPLGRVVCRATVATLPCFKFLDCPAANRRSSRYSLFYLLALSKYRNYKAWIGNFIHLKGGLPRELNVFGKRQERLNLFERFLEVTRFGATWGELQNG